MPDRTWDETIGRYRSHGQVVAPRTIRTALDTALDGAAAEVRAVTQQLIDREIGLAAWQTAVEAELVPAHLAATAPPMAPAVKESTEMSAQRNGNHAQQKNHRHVDRIGQPEPDRLGEVEARQEFASLETARVEARRCRVPAGRRGQVWPHAAFRPL